MVRPACGGEADTPDGGSVTVGANGTTITGDTSGTGTEDGGPITGTLTTTDLDGLQANPYSVTGNPTHGTASINASGNWVYTPNADYNGPDSFEVTVTDALGRPIDFNTPAAEAFGVLATVPAIHAAAVERLRERAVAGVAR